MQWRVDNFWDLTSWLSNYVLPESEISFRKQNFTSLLLKPVDGGFWTLQFSITNYFGNTLTLLDLIRTRYLLFFWETWLILLVIDNKMKLIFINDLCEWLKCHWWQLDISANCCNDYINLQDQLIHWNVLKCKVIFFYQKTWCYKL